MTDDLAARLIALRDQYLARARAIFDEILVTQHVPSVRGFKRGTGEALEMVAADLDGLITARRHDRIGPRDEEPLGTP